MSRYNYDKLRTDIEKELKNETIHERLYKSVDSIARVVLAIVDTKGEGWAAQVLDDKGQPIFNEEEQKKFTDTFQPYIQSIIGFMGNKMSDEMSGGALNNLTGATGATGATGSTPCSAEIEPTFDGLFYSIVNKINYIDKVFDMGIIQKFEDEQDSKGDIPIPFYPAVSVNARLITFLVYLALDLGRIAISSTGNIAGRKIMSILLALYEFLRGDWKKSILTMVGYYSANNLMFGEMMKIYLSMFRKLNPKIQENIVYGTLDSVKSFIVGVLLSIVKVASPFAMRKPIIDAFKDIESKKAERDNAISEAGLLPRPDYLIPSWVDLNNIQALMTDEAFICSCQFNILIESIDKDAIMKIVFEIMGIPIIKQAKERKCPKTCTDMNKDVCTTFATQAIKDHKTSELRQKPMGSALAEALATTVEPVTTGPVPVTTVPVPVKIPHPKVETKYVALSSGLTSTGVRNASKGGRRLRHRNSRKSVDK